MRETVLVTGGAGYIGSHTVLALAAHGYRPVVIDDLSTGSPDLLDPDLPFFQVSVADTDAIAAITDQFAPAAIVHLAASIRVEESVGRPLDYYANNTGNTLGIAALAARRGLAVVFSSTAAAYGDPDRIPVAEDDPTQPINPYGCSKLASEWILRDAGAANGFGVGILRYFNVAGADAECRRGQISRNASHLIKVAVEVATGQRPQLTIFGTDYDTADGTAVRDYVHVADIADAHVDLLDHLLGGGRSGVWNCGYGRGYSVHDVVDAVSAALGRPLPVIEGPRRPGDAAVLVANSDRLRRELGWVPQFDDLGLIVGSSLAWERKRLVAEAVAAK